MYFYTQVPALLPNPLIFDLKACLKQTSFTVHLCISIDLLTILISNKYYIFKNSAHICNSQISTRYRFENLKVFSFRCTERHSEFLSGSHHDCILRFKCLCDNCASPYITKLQVTIFRLYLFPQTYLYSLFNSV